MSNSQRVYFRNLDVLRFIAAYMIVWLHCVFGWKAFFSTNNVTVEKPGVGFFAIVERVLHNFSFGVDIFFLISGFLLTYLLLKERETSGRIDIPKFYIRRAFRIWPLYFLLILIAPWLTYFFYEQNPDYFYQFLFIGNFDVIQHGPKSPATDHLWSICIEEHFYLFCPLLIAFIPVRKIPQVLLLVIMATILFRGYVAGRFEQYGTTMYMHTLSRIDVLALGSLFGYQCYHNLLKFEHALSVRIIMYSIFLTGFIFTDYVECGTFFTAALKKYFFVLLAAYWIGNFLFHPNAVAAPKKQTLLHAFGKASYGIYMFNPVVVFLVLKGFASYNLQNYFLFLLLVHVLLFAVTFLSYRFIEMPFLALKEKYAVIKSGDSVNNVKREEEDQEAVSAVISITNPDHE